ncbi:MULTISPECIES: IS481 family transposase [Rhodococcus]|jgi:transposase InsO family protein|uniref:IS481 family transposase n=3 Tax=Rhodococcus TaxID=1827 RepID=A0ABU9CS98_9NOCA|nr:MULTISPECIES: IS481 family transposase [Rhodococcus]KAA0923125.1 IS481 family transposase [Rhodococcus sp. ANT_H53B]MCJ0895104.1 IS481 family transposase [Rhodococcus sp. ARC_M5]MCJ0980915.1 IS481 family transposase [Rhodococcus sp. ARC_M12]MDI9927706.1 IS481 family transposase [Rhodococcus sp. IEGM 1341]MDV6303874.1 IS481 family transposase [Rhodococcus cerastii]
MPTSPNDSLSRSAFRAITEVNDGSPVSDVAERFGVSRQTVTAWRKRYENSGIDGLVDSSRRPHASPNRIQPDIEALICEMRRHHRRWGARRICFELSKEIGDRTPSRATVHRTLVRNGLVNHQEQQHKRVYKRWQREAPMHLWQLDLVGGMFLVGGRECKMLTGIDDHSRFIVTATVLEHPSGNAVCEAFIAAIHKWGSPFEVLTDNGKQFTGKHTRPLPAEVLFERTCREFGITARLTRRHSPTTTGKIERFHRTLRREFLDEAGAFADIAAAQAALDEWVHAYNTLRPHQSLDMATPASLFRARAHHEHHDGTTDNGQSDSSSTLTAASSSLTTVGRERSSSAIELDTQVPPSGVTNVAGAQQLWIGSNHAGRTVTLWIDLVSIHVILDDTVIKTVRSRLTHTDLERLAMRGTRQGRPSPATAAVDTAVLPTKPRPIEVDRTAGRDGTVILAGHRLHLGADRAGTRVTLRIASGLIHASVDNVLLATLPNPLDASQLAGLTGAREATGTLPAPPPAGPQTVQRRVPKDGRVMVTGQLLKVGRTHAGTIVTVVVEDNYFRVLDGTTELGVYARTSTKAIRNFNAHRPRSG